MCLYKLQPCKTNRLFFFNRHLPVVFREHFCTHYKHALCEFLFPLCPDRDSVSEQYPVGDPLLIEEVALAKMILRKEAKRLDEQLKDGTWA